MMSEAKGLSPRARYLGVMVCLLGAFIAFVLFASEEMVEFAIPVFARLMVLSMLIPLIWAVWLLGRFSHKLLWRPLADDEVSRQPLDLGSAVVGLVLFIPLAWVFRELAIGVIDWLW